MLFNARALAIARRKKISSIATNKSGDRRENLRKAILTLLEGNPNTPDWIYKQLEKSFYPLSELELTFILNNLQRDGNIRFELMPVNGVINVLLRGLKW